MSLLTEVEQAYRQQQAAVRLAGAGAVRRAYRRAEQRAAGGDQVALARLAALRHECIRRGMGVPDGRL